MPEIQHLPSGTDKHNISARLKQDGALILDDVINPEFIKALRFVQNQFVSLVPSLKIYLPAGCLFQFWTYNDCVL